MQMTEQKNAIEMSDIHYWFNFVDYVNGKKKIYFWAILIILSDMQLVFFT